MPYLLYLYGGCSIPEEAPEAVEVDTDSGREHKSLGHRCGAQQNDSHLLAPRPGAGRPVEGQDFLDYAASWYDTMPSLATETWE